MGGNSLQGFSARESDAIKCTYFEDFLYLTKIPEAFRKSQNCFKINAKISWIKWLKSKKGKNSS